MKKISAVLAIHFLNKALNKTCPIRIPRSGIEGKQVNCFSVAIDKNEEPYLLVRKLNGESLVCSQWNGSSYETEITIHITDIDYTQFRIIHYYGLSEVVYFGINDFLIDQITKISHIKINFYTAINKTDQYFFNKTKLVTKQRIELLNFLVSQTMDGRHEFNVVSIMTNLYTHRWVLHPEKDSQKEKLKLYLASLVATGELCETKLGYYKITGLALHSIEVYEEKERKHTESVKMQGRMFWLTVLIALLTLIQSGLVKLPPIFDFTA